MTAAAVMGADYADDLQTQGGPDGARAWSIVEGAPAGLTLNRTTGRIAGVAETEGGGVFGFTVQVASSDEATQRGFTMTVTKPALAQDAVLDDLLGGAALTAAHRRFLDLLGNRIGRVDVGDVRA